MQINGSRAPGINTPYLCWREWTEGVLCVQRPRAILSTCAHLLLSHRCSLWFNSDRAVMLSAVFLLAGSHYLWASVTTSAWLLAIVVPLTTLHDFAGVTPLPMMCLHVGSGLARLSSQGQRASSVAVARLVPHESGRGGQTGGSVR